MDDRVLVLRTESATLNVDASPPMRYSDTWYSWLDEFGTVHWADKAGADLLQFGSLTVSRADATADALYLAEYKTWIIWPRKDSNAGQTVS